VIDGEIIVDSFAGGGGASLGIKRALGRGPDVAINHDAAAIAMHAANHPETVHFTEDVWKVSPRKVTRGRRVGLLWASPDCKHFSRAKGSKPVEKNIRSLAWVVVRWAEQCEPRVIVLENVREFEEWGPLLPLWTCSACGWKGTEGQATLVRHSRRRCPRCESKGIRQTEHQVPDPARKGLTFRRFVGRLKNLGYQVQWKVLNAADFGAPTHRRRLFLIARNDGAEICWPEPTHGDPKKIAASETDLFPSALKPWRTAAEIIDWSIPCPSIFERKRPLKPNTLRRIAMGIKRYVLDNPRPFIVRLANTGDDASRSHTLDEPLRTIHGGGGSHAVVAPILAHATHQGERRSHTPDEPLPTVTGANRGEIAVVAPYLVRGCQTGGNGKYTNGTDEPLTSVVSKAEHMLIAPTLIQTGYGERPDYFTHVCETEAGDIVRESTSGRRCKVCGVKPTKREGQAPRTLNIEAPMGTVVAGGCKQALVAAFIAKHYGGWENRSGVPADVPLPTTTASGGQNQLVAANLIHLNNNTRPTCPGSPLHTVTGGGNHAALVYSFLTKYFGRAVGQVLDEPLHTVTSKDHFGVITVTVDGEPYVIADIGMRMLTPRELAKGQGFDDDYILTGSNTSQVARIGNSVAPDVAEAIVRANCGAEVETYSGASR